MRYRLRFLVDHDCGSIMPLNYQLEIYRLIRDVLMEDKPAFLNWLDDNGAEAGAKLQLFNFSNLIVVDRKIYGDRLLILSDTVELTISFLFGNNTDELMARAFDRLIFTIGDDKSKVRLKVIHLERLLEPNFSSSMSFIARSPIVVPKFEANRYARFLAPTDEGYLDLFIDSLLKKHIDFHGLPLIDSNVSIAMEPLTEPKSKLLEISGYQRELVKGYLFRFSITAPKELLEIGYKIGFGAKNHLGFGFCDILFNDGKLRPTLNHNHKDDEINAEPKEDSLIL